MSSAMVTEQAASDARPAKGLTLGRQIIIDTDPGVDDVLAMLLAFSAKEDELAIRLVSVTYGNVEIEKCLRNVATLFHQIGLEKQWRKAQGKDEGFGTLKACKPIVAAGAQRPLGQTGMKADYFHGIDGLAGSNNKDALSFEPSLRDSHLVMLDILAAEPPDTISIVALGPLTNLAIAAAHDPETFLRCKEVVVMGGAIAVPGNITPLAEFNIYSDPLAASRLLGLTSPKPSSTLPETGGDDTGVSDGFAYPKNLSRRLRLVLYPLDTTTEHNLHPQAYTSLITPLLNATNPSPLALWLDAFIPPTFAKLASLYSNHAEPFALHDPLCIWHILATSPPMRLEAKPTDLRIETAGQWSRGFCIVDKRGKDMGNDKEEYVKEALERVATTQQEEDLGGMDELVAIPGDHGGWMAKDRGNRVWLPDPAFGDWKETFGEEMVKRILGLTAW